MSACDTTSHTHTRTRTRPCQCLSLSSRGASSHPHHLWAESGPRSFLPSLSSHFQPPCHSPWLVSQQGTRAHAFLTPAPSHRHLGSYFPAHRTSLPAACDLASLSTCSHSLYPATPSADRLSSSGALSYRLPCTHSFDGLFLTHFLCHGRPLAFQPRAPR